MNVPPDVDQIDAVLCEDGVTIMFYGHSHDPDRTYVAAISRPHLINAVLPSSLDGVLAGEALATGWAGWASVAPLTWAVANR